MLPARIAVATRCFRQPLRQSLETARQIGARAVQFDARNELKPSELSGTGRRQFLHELADLDLAVASLWFPTRRPYYDLDQLEARVAATKAAMQFAYQLKASIVTARVGRIPDDPESEDYQVLCAVLNDLARYGNRVGATLAITPGNESPETLSRLIENVTEGPIGINCDPAVFVMSGHDPAEALRALHELILHVQVRDALRDVDGGGLEVPVGRGEVQWDEFLAVIDEAAFHGWLTVERTTGDDKLNDVARAIEYLNRLKE